MFHVRKLELPMNAVALTFSVLEVHVQDSVQALIWTIRIWLEVIDSHWCTTANGEKAANGSGSSTSTVRLHARLCLAT